MKVLVTGGAGFIGSHSVEALCLHGHDVLVLDNFSTGDRKNIANCPDIEIAGGDIRDFDGLRALLRVNRVDAILHLAALTSDPLSVEQPREYHDVNLTGTLNVLDAGRLSGVRRVVLASSSAVYGSGSAVPSREDDQPSPGTPYGLQKWLVEQYAALYARLYKLETVCLRYFNVYGPRDNPRSSYAGVISIFLKCMSEGARPEVCDDGLQTRDYIYVKDVAEVNALALTSDEPSLIGNPMNVGTGKECSVLEVRSLIAEQLNCSTDFTFGPSRIGDTRRSCADVSLLSESLGFIPEYTLRKGLRLSIESVRDTV